MEAIPAGPATFIHETASCVESERPIAGRGLSQFVRDRLPEIEETLAGSLPAAPFDVGAPFNAAVRDAIFPGGKRLRPILTLLGAELCGGTTAKVLPAAAAVEFVHTSSLIFDDLPSMDNAENRRGRESLHRKFGDSLATLVAISFLNEAYKLVSTLPSAEPPEVLAAIGEMSECVGPAGMIGGQVLDLNPLSQGSLSAFDQLKNRKTSGLIRMALNLGAILSRADAERLAVLTEFAAIFGSAYQKSDDIIDFYEDKDRCPSSFGLNGDARGDLEECVSEGKKVLASAFPDSPARACLGELLDYTVTRLD